MVRNTLQILLEMYDKPNHKLTASITIRYMLLELDNFIKYHTSMIGKLTEKQKKYVLCLADFLKEITKNRDTIRKIRNGWIAHIQDEDNFKQDIMDLIRESNFDRFPQDILIMGKCAICYVHIFLPDFRNCRYHRASNCICISL